MDISMAEMAAPVSSVVDSEAEKLQEKSPATAPGSTAWILTVRLISINPALPEMPHRLHHSPSQRAPAGQPPILRSQL